MGIYLCSVHGDDWAADDVLRPAALAIAPELERRGLAPCPPPPSGAFAPHSGMSFEEKMNRPIQSFERLCRAQPDGDACCDALLDWDLLLPIDFDEPVKLPVPAPYSEITTVRSAHRARDAAQLLADSIALPHHVPLHCDNLDLGNWFDSPSASAAAASHPGAWSDDLDASYYVAVYLRAAQHAIRRNCPMYYV
ncbi:hypothetical protein ABT084_00595 [Streptomyces sp. NPDC002138]|uniref:hypothetical protein n=1 Tax=Streptomyces sp. NPDC002138 TaxID=3154410 RepID=UPI00331E663E